MEGGFSVNADEFILHVRTTSGLGFKVEPESIDGERSRQSILDRCRIMLQ